MFLTTYTKLATCGIISSYVYLKSIQYLIQVEGDDNQPSDFISFQLQNFRSSKVISFELAALTPKFS